MFEFEVTGKTISEAIEKGLKTLGITDQETTIKIKKQAGNFTDAEVVLVFSEDVYEKLSEDNKTLIKKQQNKNKKHKGTNILSGINITQIQNSLKTDNKEDIDFKEVAKQFVLGVFDALSLSNVKIETQTEDNQIKLDITCEECEKFLKNKTFVNSFQYLVNNFLSTISRKANKVVIDINNYKIKQIEVLKQMAKDAINQLSQTTTYVALKPMNSFERHIIHDVVAEFDGIVSRSEGEEPERFVIIEKEEKLN